MNVPIAFLKWFLAATNGSVSVGAGLLYNMCHNGPSDSVVWELLEYTSDVDAQYTMHTFEMAAYNLLHAESCSICASPLIKETPESVCNYHNEVLE